MAEPLEPEEPEMPEPYRPDGQDVVKANSSSVGHPAEQLGGNSTLTTGQTARPSRIDQLYLGFQDRERPGRPSPAP